MCFASLSVRESSRRPIKPKRPYVSCTPEFHRCVSQIPLNCRSSLNNGLDLQSNTTIRKLRSSTFWLPNSCPRDFGLRGPCSWACHSGYGDLLLFQDRNYAGCMKYAGHNGHVPVFKKCPALKAEYAGQFGQHS